MFLSLQTEIRAHNLLLVKHKGFTPDFNNNNYAN